MQISLILVPLILPLPSEAGAGGPSWVAVEARRVRGLAEGWTAEAVSLPTLLGLPEALAFGNEPSAAQPEGGGAQRGKTWQRSLLYAPDPHSPSVFAVAIAENERAQVERLTVFDRDLFALPPLLAARCRLRGVVALLRLPQAVVPVVHLCPVQAATV